MSKLTGKVLVAATTALVLMSCATLEEEDSVDRDYSLELPRLLPRSVEEALTSFELQPGFAIELAAAEPLIRDPIALSFDEKSRLYVLEMPGYSEERDDRLGAVKRLEDRDGDGFFETATTFVEGLSWPTGLIWANGGIYVGQAPELLFFADRDEDGRADSKEVVFTGFGTDNVQGLLNGFAWGVDNRVHASASLSGGSINRPGSKQPTLELRGRDFAFDPRSHSISAESGGGQYGLALDPWGRKYVCHNSDHVIAIVYDDRYTARNPFLKALRPAQSAAAEGRQAPVFRVSPVEPWRTVRTRLRVKGLVGGPIEGGGTASGYVTGASGITVYKGDLLPPDWHGDLFTGEVSSNVILHSRPQVSGIGVTASRVEQGTEFLRSTDNWFRPVFLANGPDGALYLADMYREVVEHPASLPPTIKRHLDLSSGSDRGRIYRIVPRGGPRRPWPEIGRVSTKQLVELLDHPNGWHRETASRLLHERQDEGAVADLRLLSREGTSAAGRLLALHTLRSLGALRPGDLSAGLADPDARVRIQALILSEPLLNVSPQVLEAALKRAEDEDLRVRFQAAFSLGEATSPGRLSALVSLLEKDGGDPWLRMSVMSSLRGDAVELFQRLLQSSRLEGAEYRATVLTELALQAAAGAAAADLASLVSRIEQQNSSNPHLAEELARGLMRGVERSERESEFLQVAAQRPLFSRVVSGMVDRAMTRAGDVEAPADERVSALRDLGFGSFASASPLLLEVLGSGDAFEVQLAALQTLSSFRSAEIAERIIGRWASLSPDLRSHALEALLARKQRIESLLRAIEEGRFSTIHLDSTRTRQLLAHRDPTIRQRAARLFRRSASLPDLEEQIRRVLRLSASPQEGKALFRENCSQCHRLEGTGFEVGPALTTYAGGGGEKLLTNVLDPNRELNPRHVFYIVETSDGESHSGIIAAESPASVTLRRPNGVEKTILRRHVSRIESLEVSIMPQGWTEIVGEQGLADLTAYITGLD